ncbi:MAG: 5-oxopent-3-ene-1,2,5-tricarboxylate decarboxylase, partial [Pseudomonadota bacterium]
MRIIQFQTDGRLRIGLLRGDGVVDVAKAAPSLPATLDELVQAGQLDALNELADRTPDHALHDLALCPPLTRPGKIICLGLNYVDHAAEGGHARPEYPSFFLRTPES